MTEREPIAAESAPAVGAAPAPAPDETSSETIRLAPGASSRRVFVSYAHEDWESAARLAEELQARGLRIWQDVADIRLGKRVEAEMENGIASSDAVLHLLTPASIASDPVAREIALSTRRRRREGEGSNFVVMAAARGIGDSHADVGQRTLELFGENFANDWLEILPEGTEPVTVEEAASFARKALRGFFRRGTGPRDGNWRIGLHTRAYVGDGHDLELDWRPIFGSDLRGPGDFESWRRCWRAVRDVRDVLADHSPRRAIALDAAAHQTAATLFGLAFCANGRYQLAISDPDGRVWTRQAGIETDDSHGFRINLQHEAIAGNYLTIEIEIAREVVGPVGAQIADAGEEPRARLLATPAAERERMEPGAGAKLAVEVAERVKQTIDEFGIERVEVYPAAPLAFMVLFAAELGALGADLALFEFHSRRYVPSLTIAEEER